MTLKLDKYLCVSICRGTPTKQNCIGKYERFFYKGFVEKKKIVEIIHALLNNVTGLRCVAHKSI